MRLYTTLAVTAAAAAFTFNFWLGFGDAAHPVIADRQLQPLVADAVTADTDDELTVMLRREARTAMLDLQRRQAQF